MCDNPAAFYVSSRMHQIILSGVLICATSLTLVTASPAQDNKTVSAAASAPASQNDTKIVPLTAVIMDKRGPVKDLSQADFAVTVDGKPQTIRSFARVADVPLTVGVIVDVSRTQASVVDGEQKATQTFLDGLLKPANDGHAATRAFVMQYARTAELLQDVTNSESLLGAGLKQVGTVAPGSTDDEDAENKDNKDPRDTSNNGGTGNSNPGSSNPNNGGGNRGPYGRNGGGNNGGNGNTGNVTRRRTGAALYDSVFLATDDVTSHQPGRRVLVLLSDGVDRHSKESLTEALEAAQRADTVVYAIYIKTTERNTGMTNRFPGGGGYDPYDPYDPYGYPRQNYPGSGGSPGSDGTYADPDGRKILQRICGETGGHMFEAKGKDALSTIYAQITDELRGGYLLGIAPSTEVGGPGYHKLQVTLTRPDTKKDDLQTRDGYYAGPAKAQ